VSRWRSVKARKLLRALQSIGRRVKRRAGSHRRLERKGYPDFTFAFHDDEEIGPKLLAKIGKQTGLKPEDL